MTKKVHVKSYYRKGKRVKGYSRDKRPEGKKKFKSKEKYLQIRDEYGRVLGYVPANKKKKK